MRTREELEAMTVAQLRAYAKEIGCCLGYDASLKASTVRAILSHQDHLAKGEPIEPRKHPWREYRSVSKMPVKSFEYYMQREEWA